MTQNSGRTRRGFLRDTLTAAAGVGLFNTITTAAEPAAEQSEWPVTCRDTHLREIGEPNIWKAMARVGVDGVEVELRPDGTCSALSSADERWSIATEDDVKRLGGKLEKEDRRITAFCTHNRFDERPEEEIEEMARVIRAARLLRVPAVRIDFVPRKLTGKEDEFLKFTIDMGKRLLKVAGDSGVRYGIENHGNTTNRPEFLRRVFDAVGSTRFGLTLDTANFYWFGHPLSKLYDIYEEFAPYVCHTHCKSIHYPEDQRDKQRPMGWEYGKYCAPIHEGDIDFKRVAAILRKSGYRNDLCIENESLRRFPEAERGDVLQREAALLRRIGAQR